MIDRKKPLLIDELREAVAGLARHHERGESPSRKAIRAAIHAYGEAYKRLKRRTIVEGMPEFIEMGLLVRLCNEDPRIGEAWKRERKGRAPEA